MEVKGRLVRLCVRPHPPGLASPLPALTAPSPGFTTCLPVAEGHTGPGTWERGRKNRRNEAFPGDSGGGPERKISLTEECKGPGTQNSNREEEAEF